METVFLSGEKVFVDLMGITPRGRLACMGFVGRKAGIERALIALHKGQAIDMPNGGQRWLRYPALGEAAYKAVREPLATLNRLTRVYVMPSSAVHHIRIKARKGQSDEDKVEDREKVLIWRSKQGINETRSLWNWIKKQVAIPVLDSWRDPVLDRLSNMEYRAEQDHQDSETDTAPPTSSKAIEPLDFKLAGDGHWRGAVINITDEMMAEAVHDALVTGQARAPRI